MSVSAGYLKRSNCIPQEWDVVSKPAHFKGELITHLRQWFHLLFILTTERCIHFCQHVGNIRRKTLEIPLDACIRIITIKFWIDPGMSVILSGEGFKNRMSIENSLTQTGIGNGKWVRSNRSNGSNDLTTMRHNPITCWFSNEKKLGVRIWPRPFFKRECM